jgi:Protein of unknown function (DUF2917)
MFFRKIFERHHLELGAHDLATRATLRVDPHRKGVVLRAERGLLLVTQAGDPEDHVLAAGGELRLTGRGLVVAEALAGSTLTVGEPRAESPRRLGYRPLVTS